MTNKNILVISIITVLLIIVILISCILLLNNNARKVPIEKNIISENNVEPYITKVSDNTKFYTVTNCISQYLNELNKNHTKYYGMNDNGEYVKIIEESYIKQNIYNLLSQEYIQNNSITINNVYNYVYDIKEQVMFVPIKMNVLSGTNVEKYVTYGVILNGNNELIKEIYIIVNLDINYKTFSIEQINKKYTNIEDIEITNEENRIDEKDNNTFKYTNATPEYVAKQYLNTYKRLALVKPELAYNYLDKEYRIAKFGNLENYKAYVEKNRNIILAETISKYKVTQEENYKQYVCITNTENYYIFKETGVMEYTTILDTFTIDLPEYIEKYNSSQDKQKVAYCIDKFIKNINAENYTLAYNMISQGFKNNYFKNQASFETYAKQNFLGKDKIEFTDFKNEGEVYIYTVTLTNSSNEANKIQKNFNVKLKEGTNFEISFNVN